MPAVENSGFCAQMSGRYGSSTRSQRPVPPGCTSSSVGVVRVVISMLSPGRPITRLM